MKPLYHTGIYVNRAPDSLKQAARNREISKPLEERKPWLTGVNLLREAQAQGCELPLIFGYLAPLTGWAAARRITVSGKTTTYRFSGLQSLSGCKREDLTVASTRRPLSNSFIRSYAIVRTPDFLRRIADGQSPVGNLDRNSREQAAQILASAFPSSPGRKLVLSQLADSISWAEAVAPQAWAVTLFHDGFRLNVGRVAAFTAFSGEVRLFLYGSGTRHSKELLACLSPALHKSVPEGCWVFRGSVTQFKKHCEALRPVHHAFIEAAGSTTSGKPMKATPYRKFNSPGLVSLATGQH